MGVFWENRFICFVAESKMLGSMRLIYFGYYFEAAARNKLA